jgi:hypothetical protein
MHARRSIYLTFGQWGVQAALDISNIRPLKVNTLQTKFRNILKADGIFCEQIDSATMGSRLAPVTVNIYMESSEQQEINTMPKKP